MSIRSQRDLTKVLSKLKGFTTPSIKLEQYQTPPHIAAEWIWSMALGGEIAGKTILDAASGPGILGLGLLLMGAKKIFFVDKSNEAMKICIENYNNLKQEYELGEAEFIIEDISLFDGEVDLVVQNPPFGTKEKHIDKLFLEKAFTAANIVYSMHKYSTKEFVEAISRDHSFKITQLWRFSFPIPRTHSFHKKEKINIDVGLWRMKKQI